MTKQMPVTKNFSNAGLVCSAGLGSDLLRLCLKRYTSLLNSFFNWESGREEEHFCFVSSLMFFGLCSSVLAYVGSISELWYHQQYCVIAKLL